MPSVNPQDLPIAARNAVLCALKDLIGAYQCWSLRGKPDSFHDWSAHLASIDELALEFELQQHIPKGFPDDMDTVATQPENGLQGNAGIQWAINSQAQRLAIGAGTVASWQSRLGNSEHLLACGAVGEAMQAEIDALSSALSQAQEIAS